MVVIRYRYFCCGVVFISVSWAVLLVIYTTHLETESKNNYVDKRRMIRGQMRGGEGDVGRAAAADEERGPDDKAAWDLNFKRGGVDALKKREEERRNLGQKKSKNNDIDDDDPVVFNRPAAFAAASDDRRGGGGDDLRNAAAAAALTVSGNPKNDIPAASVAANLPSTTAAAVIDSINNNNQVPLPRHELDLDALAVIKSPEDQKVRDYGYDRYAFNLLVSDRIGFQRDVRDVRHNMCKSQVYPSELPKASIIICFYNEAQSTLFRMLHSIMDRTPLSLIHEILVIDDNSDDKGVTIREAQKHVESQNWPKIIQFLVTPKREGLIRAKTFGAHKATGEALIFLDSHCEVNAQWIQPLLTRIKERPHNVVCPIIDIIDPDTFKYVEAPVCMGGFNWALNFKWDYPPWSYFKTDFDHIKPLRSPTMAGGLFAIRKDYFHHLGEYDPGMEIWGAENVEISFRIWMCGGELEIMPCSRIGHIFRKRRPYGSPDHVDTMAKNAMRTAKVWLDEFEGEFLKHRPEAKHVEAGNVTGRLALRQQLNCKTFRWYLENVYPELLPADSNYSRPADIPADGQLNAHYTKPKIVGKYLLQLSSTKYCLSTGESEFSRKGAAVNLDSCNAKSKYQTWHRSEIGELRLNGMLCLDAYKTLRLMKCDGQESFQTWKHTDKQLYNAASGKCITALKQKKTFAAQMDMCAANMTLGQWEFVPVSD